MSTSFIGNVKIAIVIFFFNFLSTIEIYTIINALAAQGKAVIVISSELPELLGICDRIYALSAGRITGQLPIAEATPESLMSYMTKEKE